VGDEPLGGPRPLRPLHRSPYDSPGNPCGHTGATVDRRLVIIGECLGTGRVGPVGFGILRW
ncbi:MAG: hypothetical protein ACO4CU_08195, partial [Ilumatobacteraceae bacterium]